MPFCGSLKNLIFVQPAPDGLEARLNNNSLFPFDFP